MDALKLLKEKVESSLSVLGSAEERSEFYDDALDSTHNDLMWLCEYTLELGEKCLGGEKPREESAAILTIMLFDTIMAIGAREGVTAQIIYMMQSRIKDLLLPEKDKRVH